MIDIAEDFRVSLPAWIDDDLADTPAVMPDRADRMRLVHRLADRNWRAGDGGPVRGTGRGAGDRRLGSRRRGPARAGPELEEITTFYEGPLDETLTVFRNHRKAVDEDDDMEVCNARGGTG